MRARTHEMKTMRGQARALATAIEQEIKPIVEKCSDFVDGTCMIFHESQDSLITMSSWQSKEAADKCQTEGYRKASLIHEHFIEAGGIHRTCDTTLVPTLRARAAKAWRA